jgi:hypothetical protein
MRQSIRSTFRVFCLVAFAIIMMLPSRANSQPSVSGFYVILTIRKNCPHNLSTRDGTKTYCLTKEPVIAESDFESVGDVQFDSLLKEKFILLKLTDNGYNSFKFMANRLPDSRLVLVIDDQVAGVFDHVDKHIGRTIPIRGGINAAGIDWVHDRLKKAKP